MDDHKTLTFYQLCFYYNLDGLKDKFGDLSDTSSIDMDYAYYIVCNRSFELSDDSLPILEWLLKIDPNIDVDRITNDYMADEHIPNDAFWLACKLGHLEVVKWLFAEEPYLSSFKNRCNICDAFKLSCCNGNVDITKTIFNKLAEYISERLLIINDAYKNAMKNQHAQTAEWLLEINPNINTKM